LLLAIVWHVTVPACLPVLAANGGGVPFLGSGQPHASGEALLGNDALAAASNHEASRGHLASFK